MPTPPIDVFCDFDGTITKHDVVDMFLDAFASPEWLEIEALWRNQKIGSKECLERQVRCVSPLSEKEMAEFIDGIEVDPHFLEFARSFTKGRITILSDGFDVFIQRVLDKHGLRGIRHFSNRLVWKPGEPLRAEFPHLEPLCKTSSGTCKCRLTETLAPGRGFWYVGDGQSDFCVSREADVVLAKGKLAHFCRDEGIPFVEFHTFQDISRYFAEPLAAGTSHEK
jgi:2-hydroxy-3-keto-5-methylthiopentenyl-1-phosphate phosphatase